MSKINVYLPDELADTVKELNIPVSAICQRALEGSVKRITAIRSVTVEDLAGGGQQFTERARTVIRLAAQVATGSKITTAHLLGGIVTEGANLALDVLHAIDIEPRVLSAQLSFDVVPGSGFASDAANALELAVVEAVALGHNYVGCEHLLLGLIAEPDGKAGEVLRGLGMDIKSARRAVQTALAGIVHAKKQQVTPDAAKILELIMTRLARLEQHVGIG